MYTGLSGLNVNQTRIDTIGNNIANVNTTAYKGSRTLFQTQLSQTLSTGTPPSATSGGVNPTQIGLGAVVGATQKNFNTGSIETTGIASDLAIEGAGFFVLNRADGRQVYSRDGAFSLDSNNRLVSIDGNLVQGFGVDQDFNILPNVLTDLTIPLGTESVARATQNARIDGDLSAGGSIATIGTGLQSQALVNGGNAPADGATPLTDLRSAADPATPMYQDGSTITVSGVTKGGRSVATQTFVVGTDGSTLGDFATWMQSALGIQADAALPGQPGVAIENGQLVVRGNAGVENQLVIANNNITSDSAAAPGAFDLTKTQDADGSGVFTSFTVYDSLGNPQIVRLTFTLDSTPDTGPVWRYYAESVDDAGVARAIVNGTATFDTNGNFVAAAGNDLTINRGGSGAADPLTVSLDLSGVHGLSTRISNVIAADQDGFPPGTLTTFAVGDDGTITGTFSNGLTRSLGQVALAMFANPEGLVSEDNNLFSVGPNTGRPSIAPAATFGAGSILPGALELSNVDLSREFIGLIRRARAFRRRVA